MEWIKIVTTVPLTHADTVRRAAGEAGAGIAGNYRDCSFSVRGIGRFLPVEGANPALGAVGKSEEVEEEQIWWSATRDQMEAIVVAIREAHPYEEVIIDVYPLEKV